MVTNLKLKPALDGIERWMDEKGPGGKSFRESLEAGGVIASDLVVVAGAINGMLACGLTREALLILITAKCKRAKNGSRLSEDTVEIVLEALENLHHFIETPAAPVKK